VKAPAELQRAFAAVTGAPSPRQWAAAKAAEREAARARYVAGPHNLPPAHVEALAIWRDARGDLALAVDCALRTHGDDDAFYREVCQHLQAISDARSEL